MDIRLYCNNLSYCRLDWSGISNAKNSFTNHPDGELASPNIFTNKSNFKWYAIIGIGIACWYIAERL